MSTPTIVMAKLTPTQLAKLLCLDSDSAEYVQRAYMAETIRGALWHRGDAGLSETDLLRILSAAHRRLEQTGVASATSELSGLPKRRQLLRTLTACGEIGDGDGRYVAAPLRLISFGKFRVAVGSIPTPILAGISRPEQIGAEGILRTLPTAAQGIEDSLEVPLRRWLRVDDYATWWPRWKAHISPRLAVVAHSALDGLEVRQFAPSAQSWQALAHAGLPVNELILARRREQGPGARVLSNYFVISCSEAGAKRIAEISRDDKRLVEIALAKQSGNPMVLKVRKTESGYELRTFMLPRLLERQVAALSIPSAAQTSGQVASILSSFIAEPILAAIAEVGMLASVS